LGVIKIKDNKKINVTLLANTGIIIQYEEYKFLIDGLHKSSSTSFSGISKPVLTQLLEADKPLFNNIRYLLFTHLHGDHFSAEYTADFLKKHKLDVSFFPSELNKKHKSLRRIIEEKSAVTYYFDMELGEKKIINIDDNFSLTVFPSLHAGKQYKDVENYCYLFNFAGKKLFIVSDSDYDVEYFKEMLKNEEIDILFVNPLFINNPRGREVITKAISPKKLIVYHIPFKEDDKYKLRKMVSRDLEKYEESLPETVVLSDELETIYL